MTILLSFLDITIGRTTDGRTTDDRPMSATSAHDPCWASKKNEI